MHRRPNRATLSPETLLFCLIAFLVFGCDALPLAGSGELSSLRVGEEPAGQVTEDKANNDLFDAAQIVIVPTDGVVQIDGTIDSADDIDIYSLGPAKAGDRLTIDVAGVGGLNTVAALFDSNRDLIDANDDRSYYAGQLDPYVSQVLRQDQENVYVGIAVARATYFSSQNGRFDSGQYSMKIIRRADQSASQANRQTVFLDFEGGDSVQIALQPFEQMRPFNAEAISSRLSGQSDYIVQKVIALMHADFADCDVVLVDSKSSPPPPSPYTTLYFGNFNRAFLGLSDNVDTGNAFLEQEAIIYTEDFSMFESLQASADEIAQAIANTGSHELGHLLGLEHAGDPLDIMATAASARQILETNAQFQRSGLEKGVFPAGWQNGTALLMQNVGANSDAVARLILGERPANALSKNTTAWREKFDFPMPLCGRCAESGK